MTDIFMIEDNPMDIELMTMALQESGLVFTLHVAGDGERGVELLENAGRELPVPGLILLDLNIPRISGLEVLAIARSNSALREMPIIIFSGSLNPRDVEAAIKGGATAFFPKPLNVDGFFATAQKLVGMLRPAGHP
ncbi:MAG: response regulator [Planctomycetes bacterium]|nr:response regulator [Planctomycetota bacterium]